MAKTYYLKFGSGDPRSYTGLSPTLVIFQSIGGTAITGPTISEVSSGSGIYKFTYGPTASISFLADGGSSLANSDRYISGALDPIQAVDEVVGTTSDSYGSTSSDPSTLMGYSKRMQEFTEGDANFNKSTGLWSIYSRGSSTLLRTKTLSNNTTEAEKV